MNISILSKYLSQRSFLWEGIPVFHQLEHGFLDISVGCIAEFNTLQIERFQNFYQLKLLLFGPDVFMQSFPFTLGQFYLLCIFSDFISDLGNFWLITLDSSFCTSQIAIEFNLFLFLFHILFLKLFLFVFVRLYFSFEIWSSNSKFFDAILQFA